MYKIILASKSEVRKDILEKNNIECNVVHSNVDEDPVKDSLIAKGANPETISKNLAELKANKVSQINENRLVLGADSVIDLNGKLISKPSDRQDALRILKLLNGKKHYLISSICLSMNGVMVWIHTDKALLIMKEFSEQQLLTYLDKISDEKLYAYNVYQIEGPGRNLFEKIEGDQNTIMGLPILMLKNYLREFKC